MKTQVHFRMDDKEKKALTDIYSSQGLSINEAFRVFAKKSLEVGGFPFELSNPNARLQKAINSEDYLKFETPEEGLDFLNE